MIIYVDIDDTICYNYSDDKMNYMLAQPYIDRINRINKLYDEGNQIVYWTARGTGSGIYWLSETKKQLESWGCKFHALKIGKPIYDLFIDDKNINSKYFFN
jgi:hypothetical protein